MGPILREPYTALALALALVLALALALTKPFLPACLHVVFLSTHDWTWVPQDPGLHSLF